MTCEGLGEKRIGNPVIPDLIRDPDFAAYPQNSSLEILGA